MLRVLFNGENWYGSNARSCVDAFRDLGCVVHNIDEQTYIPQISMFTSRVVRRLLWFRLVNEFNSAILSAAENLHPDIFIAFKGNYIHASTLQLLRARGIRLYNYYPDTSAFSHGPWLEKSLAEYDCVFYTKPFWYADVTKRVKLRNAVFLPPGYCAKVDRPVVLDARDIADYSCDVALIANHYDYKERMLNDLISLRPDLNLRIWGLRWKSDCKSLLLRKCIQGFPLWGQTYTRAIQAVRINLAIMSGVVPGASSGDLTTNRTYVIPAVGGFMLHERNSEVLELYKENEEVACFDSVEELADKIDYYLAHPEEREFIARAGHTRCVPAYSYDNRVAELLRWHYEHCRIGNPQVTVAELSV
jgi:spore maturation protein CgeB